MKKTTLAILILLLLAMVGSLSLLNRYELALVEGVVINTVLQKAPPDYPAETITGVFREARRNASGEKEGAYLEELFRLSQRLEKIQSLSPQELDEILDRLSSRPPAGPPTLP